jgi:hypothetical protein
MIPNTMVKWLAFSLYIQEIPISDLVLETAYPD